MDEKKQAGKLYLDDYKDALRGEIYELIGHNPDDAELEKMTEYAADYIGDCHSAGKLPNLSGMAYAMLTCKQEQFKQCAECGDYFLWDEINTETGEHCLNCRPYYDPDGMPGGWDDLKIERGDGD